MDYDLRSQYDPTGSEATVVAENLIIRYPPSSDETTTPGLDCLTVVLRFIYSRFLLGKVRNFEWMGASEKKNPILGYAWHSLGLEPKEIQQTAEDKKTLLKSLNLPGNSFEDFCNSALMNETFWSQFELQLFQPLITAIDGTRVNMSPSETSRIGLLELDRAKSPDLTMEAVVEGSFGVFIYEGQEVVFRPGRPTVIRLFYQSHPDPDRCLDINAFRILSVPRWQLDPFKGSYFKNGYDEYFLMAVVRLKDDHHPREYVRTYTTSGAPVVPLPGSESLIDKNWSIKDPSGRYMLFHTIKTLEDADDPKRFPEVRVSTISDEMAQRMRDFDEWLKTPPESNERWERRRPSGEMKATEAQQVMAQETSIESDQSQTLASSSSTETLS